MYGNLVLGLGMHPKKIKIVKFTGIMKFEGGANGHVALFTYLPFSYWCTWTNAHTLETFCYMKIHFRFCFFYITHYRGHID